MDNQSNSEKKSILQEFVDITLANLPIDLDPKIRKQIAEIIDRFLSPIFQDISESRLPRLALVGKTRSGKTSLMNAIFGQPVGMVGSVRSTTKEPEWRVLKGSDNDEVVEILDTRGTQEGFPPEGAPAIDSVELVLRAIRQKTPDMFLFLSKAKEVNAAIEQDLQAFSECLESSRAVVDNQEIYPVVIGIPTQCDELDPRGFWSAEDREFYSAFWDLNESAIPRTSSHPDHEYRLQKLETIRESTLVWKQHLESIRVISLKRNLKVIPVSAYMRVRKDGTLDIDPRVDSRWNIDELKNLILSELPSPAKMDFFRLARIQTEQHKYAQKIILATAGICTAIGAVPTPPGTDLPILLGIQVLQIMLIGFISGRKLTWQTATEFLTASGLQAGAGFLFREGFRALAKFVPVAGWLVSGGIAGGATYASGKLAVSYFIDGKKITLDDAKRSIESFTKGDR